jgi:hypothetical protein
MTPRKPPKRLFKNKDVIHSYQHDRATKTGMKHMTRDHLDVLQNIEVVLVHGARDDPSIDDSIIDRALQLCMQRSDEAEDPDPRVMMLRDLLEGVRDLREDVPDNIWRAGLKTVDESVRRHSDRTPGEKSYLQFIGPYVR